MFDGINFNLYGWHTKLLETTRMTNTIKDIAFSFENPSYTTVICLLSSTKKSLYETCLKRKRERGRRYRLLLFVT